MSRAVAFTVLLQLGFAAAYSQAPAPPRQCVNDLADPSCTTVPSCNVCGAYKAKPTSITFRYDASNPATLSIAGAVNTKHGITGSQLDGNLASVTCDQGSVSISGVNVVLTRGSGSSAVCQVTDSNGAVQTLDIHVSCSVAISTDDRFGSLTLIGVTGGSSACSPPVCELCCGTPPAVNPTIRDVFVDRGACEGAFFKTSGPAYEALRSFVFTGAGTDGSCATTNSGGSVDISVRFPGMATPAWSPSDNVDVMYAMTALCTAATTNDYCPDIEVQFACRETCTPSTGADPTTTNPVVFGSARFHVGFEDPSECPGPVIGSCDVCFPRGSKEKPTSLTLTYANGAPATLSISGGNDKGKHAISGSSLSGGLGSISCDSASASVLGNTVTLNNFRGSGITCTLVSGGAFQVLDIHVSCSAPIDIGDRYGALTLVRFNNDVGASESQCPSIPAPPCEMCVPPACDSTPAVTSSDENVYADHTGFSCTAGVVDPGPVKQALANWFNGEGGGTCVTSNTVADAEVTIGALDPDNIGGGLLTLAETEARLCGEIEFCPEVSLQFVCTERCTPTSPFGPTAVMGTSTFHVGYETLSECPGGGPAPTVPCDVCYPDGNKKVKPTSLDFTFSVGQSVSTSNRGNVKIDKHAVSGSILSTDLASVSCSSGNSVVNGNSVVLSGFSGSSIQCTVRDTSGASQNLDIHVSCSASLDTGDRFASLTLVDFGNSYNFYNGYGGSSSGQCTQPPPPPPPPCTLCADPCTMFPNPGTLRTRRSTGVVPNVTNPKVEVCGTTGNDRTLPDVTMQQFQAWIGSFTCTLNNPASVNSDALVTTSVLRMGSYVEFTSPNEIADLLCNPNGGDLEACHSLEVMFTCCDPCRPTDVSPDRPALCAEPTFSQFSLTDTTPPTIVWQPGQAECTRLTDGPGFRPTVEGADINAWRNSAICRDNGEILTGAAVFDEVGNPSASGDACQTVISITRSCNDECLNFRERTVVFTVDDTTAPSFTTLPTNGSQQCSDVDRALFDAWVTDNCGARADDACHGSTVQITSVLDEDFNCVLDQDAVSMLTVTATDPCGLTQVDTCYWRRTNHVEPPVIDPPPDGPPPCALLCINSTESCPCEIIVDECHAGPIENDDDGYQHWLDTNAGLTCRDGCGNGTFLTPFIFSDYRNTSGCDRTVVARFTCVDACDQTTSAWATYIIRDTTPPFIIEPLPESITNDCDLERDDDTARAAWIRKYSGEFKWADDLCQANPVCFQPSAREYKSTDAMTSFCTNDYDPVCAGDTTYTNNCHCMMNGHQSYMPGSCSPPAPPPPPTDMCASACATLQHNSGPICHQGTQYDSTCYLYCDMVYWGYTEGSCDTSPSTPPSYTPIDTAPPSYAPVVTAPPSYGPPPPSDQCHYCMGYTREVCGSDGVTYSSACHATCYGAISHTLGGCYVSECGDSNIEYAAGDFVTTNFVVEIDTSSFVRIRTYIAHDVVSQDVIDRWANLNRPLPKCKTTDTYTFFADDGCTEPINQVANYSVIDETPPVITAATNQLSECEAVTGNQAEWEEFLNTNGGATCSDDCQDGCLWYPARYADGSPGPPGVIDVSLPPVLSPCDYVNCDQCALVTFTASDGCGNLVETTAEFRLRDTTPPDFHVAEKVEQCFGAYPVGFFADFGVVIDDSAECNAPSNAYLPHYNLFGNPYSPPYGWTTIMPAGIHGVPPAYLPDAEWELVLNTFGSYVDDGTFSRDDQQCPFITIATIKVEDGCGNVHEENATHIYIDTTPPVFSPDPVDLVIECDGPNSCIESPEFKAWLIDGGGGRCADECTALPIDSVIPQFSYDIPEVTGSCPGIVQVGFTCTDFCGNVAVHSARVLIQDTTPPAAVEVIDVTRQCGNEHAPGNTLADWVIDRGSSGATDSCSAVTTTRRPDLVVPTKIGNRQCNDSSAYACWEYADDCGNSAEECGYFNVTDTVAPEISGGFDLDYTCEVNCANHESTAVAVMTKWLSDPINGCHDAHDCQEDMSWITDFTLPPQLCGTSGTVDFTVTDACGNARTVTRNYIMRESEPASPVTAPPCTVCGDGGTKRSLQALTFRWTSAVTGVPAVLQDTGSQGWAVSTGSVADGAEVTILAKIKSGSKRKFQANTVIGVLGANPGTNSIHASCSVHLFIGQQVQYSSGVLTLTGFRTNSDVTEADVCTPAPPPTSVDCDLDVATLDVCACIPVANPSPSNEEICGVSDAKRSNKPTRLVFRYVGGRVDPELVQPGKSSISGASVSSSSATISCENNKGGVFAAQIVALGGVYTVDNNGVKLGTTLECTITSNAGLTQIVELHTSCSAPLVNGHRYGALELICYASLDGSSCSSGTPRYSSSTSCIRPPPPPPPGSPPSPYSPPPPPPTSPSNCVVCGSGGSKPSLDTLTFKYVGGNQLTNFQEGKSSVSSGSFGSPVAVSIVCDATLQPVIVDGAFALAKHGKGGGSGSSSGNVVSMLGGSFDVYTGGATLSCTIQSVAGGLIQEVEIHVSCSVPLAVGDIFGSLQLVGFAGSSGVVTEANACPGILNPDPRSCGGAGVDACTTLLRAETTTSDADIVDPHECVDCNCSVCSDSGGLPTMLEFEFTGRTDYSTGAESQPLDSNIKLFHGPGYAESNTMKQTGRETIRIRPHDYGVNTENIPIGHKWRIEAASLDRAMLPQTVNFYVGQTRIKIVTNCKAGYDLRLGDEWGPVKLVGYKLDAPRSGASADTAAGHCPSSPTTNAFFAVPASTVGGSSGASSSIAVAGLVAGLLLVAVMVIGVYRHKSHQHGTLMMSDPATSTTDLQSGVHDLQWDTSVNTKLDKLRPRLTLEVEEGEK